MVYADEALLDGSSPQWNGTELPDYLTPGTDSEKADNFGFNAKAGFGYEIYDNACLLYTSPSPRDATLSRMPSSA